MNNSSEPRSCLERAAKKAAENKLQRLKKTQKSASAEKQSHWNAGKAPTKKSSADPEKLQQVIFMEPKNLINEPSTSTASPTDLSSSSFAPSTSILVPSTIPADTTTRSDLSVPGIHEPKPRDYPTSSHFHASTPTCRSTERRNFFIENILAPDVCPSVSSFWNASTSTSVTTVPPVFPALTTAALLSNSGAQKFKTNNFSIESILSTVAAPSSTVVSSISFCPNVALTSSHLISSVTSPTPHLFNGSFGVKNLLAEANDVTDATIPHGSFELASTSESKVDNVGNTSQQMDTSFLEDTAENDSDEQDEEEIEIDVTTLQSYCEYQGFIPFLTSETSYSWKKVLLENETKNNEFLPIEALPSSFLIQLENRIEEGLWLEIAIPEMIMNKNHQIAKIMKVCGFRLLIEYQYTAEQEWIHLFDKKVNSVRIHTTQNPFIPTEQYTIGPNLTISIDEVSNRPRLVKAYKEAKKIWWKSDYSVGQRFELLNFLNPSQIRVARIKAVCGRRLSVIVEEKDYPGDFPPIGPDGRNYDPQLDYQGNRWWIDQDSDFIYPVGFSNLIGYELIATPDYEEHSRKIAEAIRNNENPEYDESDISFDRTILKEPQAGVYSQVKVGNHLEILNPVAKNFQSLCAARVSQIYPSCGYMIIKILGGEQKSTMFPIRIFSRWIYPVGYAKRNQLQLDAPKKYAKRRKTSIPVHVAPPPNEKVELFKIGMRLEAASKYENAHICPATIKSLHGQVIKVAFDGWEADYDELYDMYSHDIFPVGWAEMHGYPVDSPRGATVLPQEPVMEMEL